mmetsp:Transcript_16755/g.63718  ORF Transcript_16755/g.63718 Transcript_16755/m.63718 type:complete len:259 (+) Transcript_16755:314-1090(+)
MSSVAFLQEQSQVRLEVVLQALLLRVVLVEAFVEVDEIPVLHLVVLATRGQRELGHEPGLQVTVQVVDLLLDRRVRHLVVAVLCRVTSVHGLHAAHHPGRHGRREVRGGSVHRPMQRRRVRNGRRHHMSHLVEGRHADGDDVSLRADVARDVDELSGGAITGQRRIRARVRARQSGGKHWRRRRRQGESGVGGRDLEVGGRVLREAHVQMVGAHGAVVLLALQAAMRRERANLLGLDGVRDAADARDAGSRNPASFLS